MADLQTETSVLPSLADGQNVFRPVEALRAFGASFLVNGLCPYLLYVWLQPRFPHGAVQPLLYASIFPLVGLAFGIVRKRMIDVIAVIALFEISINIAAVFLAPSIRWALAARSINGLLTATAFLVSALIGKPIIFYIARQFVSGGDPERARRFDAVNAADGGRAFFIATLVWAAGIYFLSTLNVTLALNLPPATFLLVGQITSTVVNIALIVWTIRFSRARLSRTLAAA